MDCKTARLLLDYARPMPAELPGGDVAALESHLTACPECEAVARAERQADDHLGRAVRDVPVPDGLRDRLLARLRAERRRWYRRRLLWTGGTQAAAAAGVLIALGVWGHFHPAQLPAPYLEAIAEEVSQQIPPQDGQGASPEKVEEWFQYKHHRAVVAPRDFDLRPLNYGLLTYYGMADCQGQRVPMLLFANGRDQARVYVLSDKDFNLAELRRQQATLNSFGCTIAARLDPNGEGIVYVFIYTGNAMNPFLTGPVLANG
jgi:hypothetical protein